MKYLLSPLPKMMPDKELCQNCGHSFEDHIKQPPKVVIYCPVPGTELFEPSGWFDGPPQISGFGYIQTEDGVFYVGFWEKGTSTYALRHHPYKVPIPPPMPKQVLSSLRKV